MKNWLLALGISLAIATPIQADNKIAIVNMEILFKQVAQKSGIFIILEREFKERAAELQFIERDLQNKMQRLQNKSFNMKAVDRNKLEKDIMIQRKDFSQKAQLFEQDHQRRYSEERSKLIIRIQSAVKQTAMNENIHLVFDANAVIFNDNNVKDITLDVLNQV